MPVVSAEQMLTWLDGRNGSSFGLSTGAGGTPRFHRIAAASVIGLGDAADALGRPDLELDHARRHPVTYRIQTIKGLEYALFTATGGSYAATYAVDGPPPPDTTPPTISSVSATANTNGTATVSWTTNEASNTRVDYGTAPDNLNLNASDAAMVTSHSIQLTGLTPGATYHYRVRSADAAGNAAQLPAPPAAPANFGVPRR